MCVCVCVLDAGHHGQRRDVVGVRAKEEALVVDVAEGPDHLHLLVIEVRVPDLVVVDL